MTTTTIELNRQQIKALEWLGRDKVVSILRGHNFECSVLDTLFELRAQLRRSIESGTIDPNVLDEG